MKAAVLYELNAPVKVEDVDLDNPKAGEVRVKIAANGVCHSDYSVIHGATARLDLGRIGRCSQTGHDCTADQTGFIERNVIRNLYTRGFIHHCVFSKTRQASHVVNIFAVLLEPTGAIEQRALAHDHTHVGTQHWAAD